MCGKPDPMSGAFKDEKYELGCEPSIESKGTKVVFSDYSKIPMNIVCNGFSMKDVILEVLMKKEKKMVWDNDELIGIAEAITDAFTVKLRLKQGCSHESDDLHQQSTTK